MNIFLLQIFLVFFAASLQPVSLFYVCLSDEPVCNLLQVNQAALRKSDEDVSQKVVSGFEEVISELQREKNRFLKQYKNSQKMMLEHNREFDKFRDERERKMSKFKESFLTHMTGIQAAKKSLEEAMESLFDVESF